MSSAPSKSPDPQPGPDDKPANPATSWLERFLHTLFLLMMALAVLGVLVWLDVRVHSEVASYRPIGHFIRMSGPGGLQGRVVIETDMGSYPLRHVAVIARGTPLLLEVRASGDHYICDVTRSLCIETTRDQFKAADTASTPKDSSIDSKGNTP